MTLKNQKRLVFEPDLCIGCRICENWCTMTHFKVTNPAKARIRILKDHETLVNYALYCHLCDPAPCIEACQFDALTHDEKTGAVTLVEENCVLCHACVSACPFGAVSIHPNSDSILVCNLCGGNPGCANQCPEDAIQYLPLRDIVTPKKMAISKNLQVLREEKGKGGQTHEG